MNPAPFPSLMSSGDSKELLALYLCGVRTQLPVCRTTRGTALSQETTTTTQKQTQAVCETASEFI